MANIIIDVETGEVIDAKSQFRNPSNYEFDQFDKDSEKNIDQETGKPAVSLTIPDQSYTVREILEKFTRGIPLDVSKEGTYENPEEIELMAFENAIDITDVEEQSAILSAKIATARSKKVGVVKGAENEPPDITKADKASANEEA